VSDLREIIRIKSMAEAAADTGPRDAYPYPEQGGEMARAYERLREQARALHERAGWGTESFDAEVPALDLPAPDLRGAERQMGRFAGNLPHEAVSAGVAAKVLLRQLAAWAAGHQETFEVEERMKANAAAKLEAAKRGGVGFE